MIYYSFVHSHLVYGIEICTHMKYLNKLIILNSKILRILLNAPRDTPTVVLMINLVHCLFRLFITVRL